MSDEPNIGSLNDCFAQAQQLMPTNEALARLRQHARPLTTTETLPLAKACGRILAQPLASPRQIPGFDNAAVDGYALRGQDLKAEGETQLQVIDHIAAGHSTLTELREGTAVRILTGARLPAGADTVVMQEDVQRHGDEVRIPSGIKAGINWRPAGEDMAIGAEILPAGQRLRPQDIGAAAAMGYTALTVYRPLKVAVFSTGDEIREPGTPLAVDSVYDVNRYMLAAFLGQLGAEVTDLGILADDRETVTSALHQAASEHQVILTSGGASTGDEDHIAAAIEQLGSLHFWRMAIKPGRPLAFGSIKAAGNSQDCLFIGFPGNPVATAVCFWRFAHPLLCTLGGQTWPEPQLFKLPADFELRKKIGRREWLRAQLVTNAHGERCVHKYPKQGSGILSSLVEADGLAEIPEEVTHIQPGDPVLFLPFSQFSGYSK